MLAIRGFILCECGKFIKGSTFRDYIKTSSNPSTPTIGHDECGYIFNFIDGNIPKKYSSKKELKKIAMNFAKINKLDDITIGEFLLEIDRLKSSEKMSDAQILIKAIYNINKKL